MELELRGELWEWQGKGAWHFVTLPEGIAKDIKSNFSSSKGFGSIRVKAELGTSKWQTSIFPDKKRGSYLLPIKAEVRKANNLKSGQKVAVRLELIPE